MGNTVLLQAEGPLAILTVNRPKALNALNAETLSDFANALSEIEQNEDIRVVILTGSGDKAFVAGADISYMQGLTPLEARLFAVRGQQLMQRLESFSVPVIAAVNGYALGGGCELALACDLRVCSDKAKFGTPEVSLGIIPGFGGTQRLPRLLGKGLAKELILTGNTIDAKEAYRIGLVNKVVPPEELMSAAKELAQTLIKRGPIALRLAKQAIDEGLEMDLIKGISHEADLFALCFSTKDQKEGMDAFLAKRGAEFHNN